jgi:tRNA(Ile)-lysidine synthetase-like protein
MFASTDLPNRSEPVVVAVSGGLDSVVLWHMLHKAGHHGVVAHVNYGFRGADSNADEALVRRLADQWGWECRVAHPVLPAGNRQDEARKQRYAFFELVRAEIGASAIVLAHHEDDQVETIVLKLLRGARLDACHGMKPKRGYLVRPLLHIPRRELIAYAKIHKLSWRDDASNLDRTYLRNRIRLDVIPRMDRAMLLSLGRTSEALALDMDRILARHTDGAMVKDSLFLGVDADVAKVAVCRFARGHGVRLSDEEATALTRTTRWQTGKKIGPFLRERDGWVLPSVSEPGSRGTLWLNAAVLGESHVVRAWQAGDRIDGKKISDIMTDAKWPSSYRSHAEVVVAGDGRIAAVRSGDLSHIGRDFRPHPESSDLIGFN